MIKDIILGDGYLENRYPIRNLDETSQFIVRDILSNVTSVFNLYKHGYNQSYISSIACDFDGDSYV